MLDAVGDAVHESGNGNLPVGQLRWKVAHAFEIDIRADDRKPDPAESLPCQLAPKFGLRRDEDGSRASFALLWLYLATTILGFCVAVVLHTKAR
jgi:hypothetical protein